MKRENTNIKPLLKRKGLDFLMVTDSANMRYLSGFTGEGYLILGKDKGILVTDSRYTIAARTDCPEFEVIDRRGHYYKTLWDILNKGKYQVGYEAESMSVSDFDKIKSGINKTENNETTWIAVDDELAKLRMVKSKDEVEAIAMAEQIGDRAFSKILEVIKPGMKEKEVAAYLDFFLRMEGGEGNSFETIAVSGYKSAMPHGIPGDKILENGDFLTMDFGCTYQGYCSDMTRTIVIGDATPKHKEIYNTVLEAQRLALEAIKPGRLGKEVDAIARDYIASKGYGECFGHGLGHSVGLKIHESPCFNTRDITALVPGMVITVEPGIYVEGFGGVRIEDVICVTEDGCRNLTSSPKELIVIK